MEETSSRVSLGWRREENRPGRPTVLLERTTTGIFFAAQMRSALDMILDTAAAISEVRPFRTRAMSAADVRPSSRHSRNSATVQFLRLP